MTRARIPDDAGTRRRALDPETSFIVEAPAGSGKTELLIQRYLVLLARVARPEAVLAVTFTRKAAREMRARVLDALEAAQGAEPEAEHAQATYRLAAAVVSRDRERGWDLVANPSRMRVQTIDALAAFIVGQMPWVSRMGAPPAPDDTVDDLYERAALAVLERASAPDALGDALSRLLEHLDNNVGATAGLLASMLESRDQWLRHAGAGELGEAAFRRHLDAALGEVVRAGLGDLAGSFPAHLRAEAVERIRRAASRVGSGRESNPVAGGLACLENLSDLPPDDDVDRWLALANLFLRQDGARRTHLTRCQGFLPGPAHAAEKKAFLALDPGPDFLEKLHAVRALPPAHVTDSQWNVLSALGVILPRAVAELRRLFAETGRMDFSEVSLAALSALGRPEAPSSLAFALDCRIEHILVDEFQDTSESQFELLARLTEGWEPDDGRTLFLVGDPMQSIYRFRKAEVALFLRARREGFGGIPLEPLTLRVNFRSSPAVVDWINRVVGPAFPKEENRITGAVTFRRCVASGEPEAGDAEDASRFSSPDTTGVVIHGFPSGDDGAEARIVLDVIRSERIARPSATIAVLVRSRSHAGPISRALRAASVRFQAVDMDPLGAEPVVRDLYMLTRAIRHRADRIAWLAVLRAPWCGLTLADLATIVDGHRRRPIFDLIADLDRSSALSTDGLERLERVRPIFESALATKGTLPLARWIEGVWLQLGGPAALADPNAVEHAEVYFDLVERFDRGGDFESSLTFDEAVRRLYARPDPGVDTNAGGEAAVQLLTVHKAKGLEFDTVILPGLGRRTRLDSPGLVEWLEFVGSAGAPQLLAAPVRETGSEPDRLSRFIAGIGASRAYEEETRLLYVAATRTRTRLHLVGLVDTDAETGKPRRPHRRSALSRIWESVGDEFVASAESARLDSRLDAGAGNAVASTSERGNRVDGTRAMVRVRSGWEPPAESEHAFEWKQAMPAESGAAPVADPDLPEAHRPSYEWAGDIQRRVGIVVHAILERMAEDSRLRAAALDGRFDPETLSIRRLLSSTGLSGGGLEQAEERVVAALEQTVGDPRGRWILAPRPGARSELALSGVVDGVVRRVVIDRTFVDSGVRWIVDYKTGIHEGSGRERFLDNEVVRYRSQMEQYAWMVRGFDPGPIRIGLYYPTLSGWREWAFDEGRGPSAARADDEATDNHRALALG